MENQAAPAHPIAATPQHRAPTPPAHRHTQRTDGSKQQSEKRRPPPSRLCLCAFALQRTPRHFRAHFLRFVPQVNPRRTGANFAEASPQHRASNEPRRTAESAAPFAQFCNNPPRFDLAPPLSGFQPLAFPAPHPAHFRESFTATPSANAPGTPPRPPHLLRNFAAIAAL